MKPNPVTNGSPYARNTRFVLSVSSVLFVVLNSAAAPPVSVEDNHNTVVTAVPRNGGIDLVASLTNCTDSTITLTGKQEGMDSMPALPATVDTDGRTHFVIARLTPKRGATQTSYTFHYDSLSGGRLTTTPAPYVYALPFQGAVKVVQGAGGSFSHNKGSADEEAIDFGLTVGHTVYAARPGIVTDFRSDCTIGGPDKKYFGAYNYVTIRHADGTYAEYLHLAHYGVLVKLKQHVEAGDPIALSGNTGYTSGPHLHFEVYNTIDGTTHRSWPVQFRGSDRKPFTAVEGMTYSNP